jgi:hypothetical protein
VRTFFKIVLPFYISISKYKVLVSLYLLSLFDVCVLNLSHPGGSTCYLIVVFTCISLMTNYVFNLILLKYSHFDLLVKRVCLSSIFLSFLFLLEVLELRPYALLLEPCSQSFFALVIFQVVS